MPLFYVSWLVIGAIAVVPLLIFAEKLPPRAMHKLLGRSLIIAAIIYIGFALIWGNTQWLLIEIIGVGAYAIFYWTSLKWGIIWLSLGWLLHPVWDIAVHLFGPGHEVAPAGYAVACVSFDIAVAVYLAKKYR